MTDSNVYLKNNVNKYPILIIIATLKVKTKEKMIKNVFYVSNNQYTTDLHPLRERTFRQSSTESETLLKMLRR